MSLKPKTRLEAQLQRIIDDACDPAGATTLDMLRRIAVASYQIGRATVERENEFLAFMGIPLETPSPFPEVDL